nr:MAG TPA: hypothetical protein [Caudoviricetes sp.]
MVWVRFAFTCLLLVIVLSYSPRLLFSYNSYII